MNNRKLGTHLANLSAYAGGYHYGGTSFSGVDGLSQPVHFVRSYDVTPPRVYAEKNRKALSRAPIGTRLVITTRLPAGLEEETWVKETQGAWRWINYYFEPASRDHQEGWYWDSATERRIDWYEDGEES
jgi:hypothetical protein